MTRTRRGVEPAGPVADPVDAERLFDKSLPEHPFEVKHCFEQVFHHFRHAEW